MKKSKFLTSVLSAFIMLNVFSAKAQESSEFKPSIKLSYSFTGAKNEGTLVSYNGILRINSGYSIMIDADLFKVYPRLSAGFYLGLGEIGYSKNRNEQNYEISLGVHYGLAMHYDLYKSRYWNVQLGATMGAFMSRVSTPHAVYGLTSTVNFYPLEHCGIFVEWGWGKYYFGNDEGLDFLLHGNTNLKVGVSYRL